MFDLFKVHVKKQEEKNERYNSLLGTWTPAQVDEDGEIIKAEHVLPSVENDDFDDEDEIVEKSDMLWPSLSISEEGKPFEKSIQRTIPILIDKAKTDERICMGIVYSPDEVDAQGDSASAEEIKKAAFDFMENCRVFKIMHKGKPAKIKILESYVAPADFTINKRKIKKGTWLLTTRINDSKVWAKVKDGTLTGFSMAGYAKVA